MDRSHSELCRGGAPMTTWLLALGVAILIVGVVAAIGAWRRGSSSSGASGEQVERRLDRLEGKVLEQLNRLFYRFHAITPRSSEPFLP